MKQINEHLVHGFSFAFPLIVLFSITLAIDSNVRSLGNLPTWIFALVVPVLTAMIANSIVSKIAFVPGLILGVWMNQYGLGFFGGILGGLLLGYGTYWMVKRVHVTHDLIAVLLGYVVVPLISFGLSYLIMRFVVSVPILWLMSTVSSWIASIEPTETMLLVGILALFTVVDLGGPLNKVAFTFVLEFYADGLYHITGPAIISVAIPPLSMLALILLYQKRIPHPGKAVMRLLVLGGLFGMTESAIPVVLEDPLRRLPIIAFGSVLASVFAAWQGLSNILMMVSLPGLFGVNQIGTYLIAHVIGVGVIVLLLGLVTPKKELQMSHKQV